MVIGLLMLTAIPSTIAIAEGISEKNKEKDKKKETKELRKFTLRCWCEGRSPGKGDVHQGVVVLGEEKMWIQSVKKQPSNPLHPFEGFYIDYPDEDRDPAPLGMVSMVADNPPMMNWIYLGKGASPVRHGNRTQSRPCRVGSWGSTADEEGEADENEDPGGIVFEGEERFVAVQPPKGDAEGRWEVWWDENDNKLEGINEVHGRLVLRISLERKFLEEPKQPESEEKKTEGEGVKGKVEVSNEASKMTVEAK